CDGRACVVRQMGRRTVWGASPFTPADGMIRHPIPVVPTRYVVNQAPWLIYWEITRACDLACRHCRAEAIAHRDPLELTLDEGKALRSEEHTSELQSRENLVCRL